MNTQIWVAIITTTGAIIAAMLAWLTARQNRADERTDISRDIAILKSLSPGTSTFILLEKRIAKSIINLIAAQDKRDEGPSLIILYLQLIASILAIYAILTLLFQVWVPSWLKFILFVIAASVGVGEAMITYRFTGQLYKWYRTYLLERRAEILRIRSAEIQLKIQVTREYLLEFLEWLIKQDSPDVDVIAMARQSATEFIEIDPDSREAFEELLNRLPPPGPETLTPGGDPGPATTS